MSNLYICSDSRRIYLKKKIIELFGKKDRIRKYDLMKINEQMKFIYDALMDLASTNGVIVMSDTIIRNI